MIVELPFGLVCRFITRRNWRINGDIFERDRKILELYMKENERNKVFENRIMKFLTSLLKPFEYTIPRIFKEQSMYTLVVVTKQNR